MFYVDGLPIITPEIEVIKKLKDDMTAYFQIEYLKEINLGVRNINFTCPFHKDGQERRPSCGVTIEHPQNEKAGLVHCFTCGYKGTIETFISDCFGYSDNGDFGKKWLVRNFLQVAVEERKDLNIDIQRVKTKQVQKYVSEDELDRYRYFHPYMSERKLTEEIIEKFDVGYDVVTDCLTFPVRDLNGKTLFFVRRAVKGKFFNYPSEVKKPVYGLYELPDVYDSVVVCESVINALTCYVYDKPAIALLGLGTEYQFEQFKYLKCRKLICGFDGDKAGRQATENIKERFSGHFLVTHYDLPEGKDINDLTFEEFFSLKEYF